MRIMVVDDEAPIKDYIAECIRRLGGGHELAASVSRGAQALAYLRRDAVDLVLTDITMPRMDGLELLRAVKEEWPGIDVVMLTCHDEFAYARSAMQYGAADYILKNEITPESLRALLTRLDERRAREAAQDTRLHAARYLCRALADEATQRLPADELRQYGIPESGNCFALLFRYNKNVLDALARSAMNWLSWQLTFLCHERNIALLACPRAALEEREQRARITALYNGLQALSDTRIGLSELHHSPESAVLALREAQRDMDSAFYRAPHASGQLAPPPYGDEEPLSELFIARNNAVAAMAARDPAALRREVARIFEIAREQRVSVPRLRLLLEFLVQMAPDKAMQPRAAEAAQGIEDAAHLEELEAVLDGFIGCLEADAPQYSPNITQAVAYLREHFSENITLQDMAQAVFLNNEYFSRRFKKEVGVGFSEYLLGLRLEEARRLLRQTELRVGEVAEQVGIGNVSYFSMVYKKQFGMTPNESRKK